MASSSLHPPSISSPAAAAQESSHSTVAPAGTDLALFLAPSFDASAYVTSLLRDVDASDSSGSSSKRAQQAPRTPMAAEDRKPSISLSLTPSKSSPTTGALHSKAGSDDAGARKRAQAQEDIDLSLAISRLNLAIEELDRSISTHVTANAPELLRRTSNLAIMQDGVAHTRSGIGSLDEEVKTLRAKVHDPFVRARSLQRELKVYDAAAGLVGRTAKVVSLARRLETQMESLFSKKSEADNEGEDAVVGQVHGRDLSRAALLVSELSSLLDPQADAGPDADALVGPDNAGPSQRNSVLQLKLVQDLTPVVEGARGTIVDYMEDMIVRGLRDLSPLMLGSSLQIAFNLGTLPTLVKDLLNDLTEVVRERTAAAFDLEALSRQLGSPLPSLDSAAAYSTYRGSRQRGHASEADKRQHQAVWSDALWKRLESLIVVEMGAVCSKVYLLEKVLKLKSDGETGVNFLAKALEVLGDKPSYTFWLTLAQSLQQNVATATSRSAWLAQTLGARSGDRTTEGYPKLLRLFHEFFAKIGVYTDVQYTRSHQSPETVVLLKSLAALEKTFVDRSTFRIAEVLASLVGGGSSNKVTAREEDAEGIVSMVANVLDATRFDPLLSRAIVDRCIALIDHFASKLDGVITRGSSAWAVNAEPSPAQVWNASLLRFTHTLAEGLRSVAADQDSTKSLTNTTTSTTAAAESTGTVYASTQLVASAATLTTAARTSIVTPLVTHLEGTIAAGMAKMHLQLSPSAFASTAGAKSSASGGVAIDATSGASSYASEVCDTLSQLRDGLLALYPSEVRVSVASRLAAETVELFLLHASMLPLAQPQRDAGEDDGAGGEVDRVKLRLATDMTELEFSLTHLVGSSAPIAGARGWVEDSRGLLAPQEPKEALEALRRFRRVLFISLPEVQSDFGLPRAVVLLHVVCRLPGAAERIVAKLAGSKAGKATATKAECVATVRRELGRGGELDVLDRIARCVHDQLDEETKRIVQLLRPSCS